MSINKIDMRVDDQGYGVMQIGGVFCAVMPFHELRPEQIPRIDQGQFYSYNLKNA